MKFRFKKNSEKTTEQLKKNCKFSLYAQAFAMIMIVALLPLLAINILNNQTGLAALAFAIEVLFFVQLLSFRVDVLEAEYELRIREVIQTLVLEDGKERLGRGMES